MDGKTEEVIEKYQGLLSSLSTMPTYENNDKNGNFFINKFYIVDSKGENNNSFDRTEDFEIVVEYTIKEKTDKLYLSISMSSADIQNTVNLDTMVLGWSEKHYQRYLNNNENIDKKPGIYTSTIKIPGYLINSGKYYINVELVNGDASYQNIDKKIIVDLLDESSSHMFLSGRRSGVIAKPLNWDVEYKNL